MISYHTLCRSDDNPAITLKDRGYPQSPLTSWKKLLIRLEQLVFREVMQRKLSEGL